MNRKIRLLLFISLALGFVVVAPSAIIYSQGYRLDFKKLRLIQTGSFYFMVTPRSVEITISPKDESAPPIQRNTNLLFGTNYVENMLPGSYNLVIAKEGYHSWRKRLEIQEKRVTETRNVTLIPADPGFTAVSENISNLFPILGDPKIAIKKTTDNGGWILFLHDPVRNSSTNLISSEEVPGRPVNIASSPEKEELLINMGQYYLVINPASEIRYEIKGIGSPVLDPIRANSVIHLKNGELVSYNYTNEVASVLANDIKAFNIRENGSIVWLSASGLLFENGIPVRNGNFPVKDSANYRIFLPNQSEIIIAANNIFYLLDRYASSFREVFRSDREPMVSPDRRKVAHFSDHEIQVLYLDNIKYQPTKSYGENSFLTRFSGTIGNVNWFTSHYIVFNLDDKIKVIEVDDRDHINIVELTNMSDPHIHFERSNGRLYLISNESLFISNVLIR